MGKFVHEDGRKCQWYPSVREWFHWDHEGSEPKPSERRSYKCDRDHTQGDRGEFGMPTIGGGAGTLYMGQQTAYPDHLRADITEVRLTVKPTTSEGIRIIGRWLPATMERFLRNNTKYARAQKTDLGAKGILPDINRKTSVLIDRIWFGAPVVGEDTVEVIDDLIGHLFLLRDKIIMENGEDDG